MGTRDQVLIDVVHAVEKAVAYDGPPATRDSDAPGVSPTERAASGVGVAVKERLTGFRARSPAESLHAASAISGSTISATADARSLGKWDTTTS